MLWIIMVIAVIAAVILVDQISKILVLAYLYEEQIDLIEGVLRFTYVENRGMAFGLLADHRWVFLVLSVVGIGAVSYYLFRYVRRNLSRVGLALIIGGGIGNMIDRVRLGFVVDFIDFCAFDFWVWVFNVADAAVCVGAALFVLDLLLDTASEFKKSRALKASDEKSEAHQGEGKDG
ncbi:MAG: signal peptidase II [Clostridia bacterium]|nr:signal peptidase II [Clostridia bacterium]MBR3863256.1 signal peptidase II [Clostridia bacterium]